MDLGKVGLAIGGVALVGAVGIVSLGMPLHVDATMPMGPFEIQVPAELFSFDSDSVLVVAPEVIDEPESRLLTLPQQVAPDALVAAPDEVANGEAASALNASGAGAVEAAAAYQAAAAPYAGCSGGH